MGYEHLVNTINLFSHLDTAPLAKALRRKEKSYLRKALAILHGRGERFKDDRGTSANAAARALSKHLKSKK